MESFVSVINGVPTTEIASMEEGVQNLRVALSALESAVHGVRMHI